VVASALALQNLPLVVEASVTESAVLASWRNQTPLIVLAGLCAIGGVLLLLRLIGRAYRRLEASEMALLVAHEQLDATLGNLAQGVCFFDQDQRVIVCNKRYATIFDLPDDAITPGMTLSGIIVLRIAACTFVGDSVEAFVREIAASVREGKPGDRIFDLPDGRTILGHIEPLPGRGWVATVEDITERRRAEVKIAFLARHDVLTGLANRGLFQERLTQALAMADRGRGFALLLIDLDRFKPVNDRFGHAVGDLLLCAVADRLRNVVRASATIARLGGDEFAIVELDVADSTEATSVARRVVHSIEQGFDLEGDRITIGCSIGIAMAPADGCHPIQLMKCADLALYRSKEEGRGTWRFFEPAMDTDAAERRTLAADLRNAVLLGQLEVHYQPVVGCGDRAVHGFEALARWRHPTRGMLPPGMFISIAEEVGLIADLGAWVLRQACADAVDWPGHVRIAVNLSTRQFRGRDLIGTVTSALQDAGLSADRLELEITESVPLQEDQMTLATLHDLQALGIRIALDDFGTGYSSLSYVRSFPFDTIKIDRSFVADLPVSDKTIALVRGIIDLAANLGMRITAEGVETESQFQCLAAAGCTEIQGYLISKPLPGCEIPALLDRLAHPVPV
jgi:diguanylate cyclase (GGDEF)-like protein